MADDLSGGPPRDSGHGQSEVASSGHQLTMPPGKEQQAVFEKHHEEIECLGVVPKEPLDQEVIMVEAEGRGRGRGLKSGYDGTHQAVAKRRGRPRKDCQRPKHYLGPSIASKVFPGRPRFRGKKFQHFILNRASSKVPNVNDVIDIYEDIDAEAKSTSEFSEKLLQPKGIPDNELRVEKSCSLCNLSEKGLLGQGRLKHFEPSDSFDCFHVMEEKAKEKMPGTSPTGSGNELKLFLKKQTLFNSSGEHVKIKSSKNLPPKSNIVTELMQELEVTGYKTVPESSHIFEETGGLYAHFNCAAYSDGVTKTFEKALSNVDKALALAAFQKCSRCGRFGASVKCCMSDCTKIYHYPCAIVSGAVQNANCFKIICSTHLVDAFSFGVICMACHESGDLSKLLLCTSCGHYYHGTCMEPPVLPSPSVRAGWQCLECKICQSCREPDDNKIVVCNTCDKGYHPYCVKPAIASIPKSGWKCPACRRCGDCGACTPGNGPSSRWHMNYTVCDSCYQQRNKGVACPLCKRAYRQFSQRKAMRHCTVCQKYIHEECDRKPRKSSADYVCPLCISAEPKTHDNSIVEHHIQDNSVGSSRESFLSANEESLSSDSDDAIEGLPGKISHRRTSASGENRPKRAVKPKYKPIPHFSIPNFMYSLATAASQKDYKNKNDDDDDPTEDNKLILAAATDEFVLCQDVCVMCGSFGQGEEGKLLACAQCGQCYHTYCVSVKITAVVLKKGWRCLDCTVCEGCGQPHDESRLLLCDECDISFHIYCLDPPLQEVPQGNWKCKWCVNCIKCGSKSPGVNCDWQMNYTLCGPCGSLSVCCFCHQHYEENELVIQCGHCERWLHGMCDSINMEDQAEKCVDFGYTCPLCRSPDELPPHLLPTPRSPTPEAEVVPEKLSSPVPKSQEPEPPPAKTKHPIQYFLDGVCLSESGMKYIKSLAPEQPKKIPRPRKVKQGITLADGSMKPYSFQDSSSLTPGEESKMDAATLEELAMKAYDFEEGKMVVDPPKEESKKKRPRNLQKLGIGGFSVKPKSKLQSGKEAPSADGAEVQASPSVENPPTLTENAEIDKPKRKRKPKKKTHLDESFPNYLRDAFFGKDLLMSCKKLAKSFDSHELDVKPFLGDYMKGFSDGNADSKMRMQEDVKDYAQRAISVKGKDATSANIVYKNMIKSEIESIKEEHLSSVPRTDSLGYPGTSVMHSKVSHVYGNSQGMRPSSLQPNPDSNSSWPDAEVDQSQMQKNLMKWESDEQLGLLSTISPVLYANINLPHLKIEFPAWADRVKQIAKIWRSLPPEKRQPYLQRARENRAASRTQQRSNSAESEKSQKETRTPDAEQEKQWKQFQVMRQMQQQTQQRQLLEQRSRAVKNPLEKSDCDLDRNIKLFQSKSLSEIPQFSSSGQKVFEKRWSSSALDINTTQIQDTKIKMEMPSPNQTSYLKDPSVPVSSRNPLAPHLHTSMESPLTSPKLSNPNEPLQSPNSKVALQNPGLVQNVQMSRGVALLAKDTVTPTISIPKEMVSPATPRPPSSDSFLHIGSSPSSHHLLSVVDSRAAQQRLGIPPPGFEQNKAGGPGVMQPNSHLGMPPKAPPAVVSSTSSPKQHSPSLQPPFVLQQGSLTPASIAKQLSQYKETFGSIAGSSSLLSQEKPIEQQNIERFLQEDSLPLSFPSKHQQLRELLQNKKLAEPVADGSISVSQPPTTTQPSLADPLSVPSGPSPSPQVGQPLAEKPEVSKELSEQPKGDANDLDDLDLTDMLSDKKEDQSKKRKTTAGDLVKDLETEPEEHDVIAANCGLDVLSADVGELELDDDELLGLGSDFNILEYADPELDKSLVGEGDKNNILDEHLDLDDKDEEEVIKEADVTEEKKESEVHEKDSLEPEKELPENFLDFEKKADVSFESSFQSKDLDSSIPLESIPEGPVKEEPKQSFSSCSQAFSPSADVKLEKAETSRELKPRMKVPDSAASPSYQMVSTLKQSLSAAPQSPLHLNMNLSLPQQGSAAAEIVHSNKQSLLLQEQPLLLAELVEEEKREQRRQNQEGLMSPHGNPLLSDIDFERLKDDVFSGPPDDTLLGPSDSSLAPSVAVPSSPGSFGPPPYSVLWQNQEAPRPGFVQGIKKAGPLMGSLGAGLVQKAQALSTAARPFNPSFVGAPPVDLPMDPEKLKLLNYEKHLLQQQAVLTSQQKYFETEVIKLRKVKKALNAKQRQLRKNGAELTETDSLELARVSQEQAALQKQLDQVRKQSRQNTLAIQDYRLKQQKRQQQPLQRSPILGVQSSAQSPHQFQHASSPASCSTPSVRLQSPSHMMQPSASSPGLMTKAEGPPTWQTSPVKVAQGFIKREQQFDQSPLFSLNSSIQPSQPSDGTLKSLMDIKSTEETFKNAAGDVSSEHVESPAYGPKTDASADVATTPSTGSSSILSQSLPSSVSNTLKFTLRQTGMPTGCLPTDTPAESPNELNFGASPELTSKPFKSEPASSADAKPETDEANVSKNLKSSDASKDSEHVDETSTRDKNTLAPEDRNESSLDRPPEVATTSAGPELSVNIKQEVLDPVEDSNVKQESAPNAKGNDLDEEVETINKISSESEQNVLLKQLLQNCPSAETPRKTDDFIVSGLRSQGEEEKKIDLPFDVDKLSECKDESQNQSEVHQDTPPLGKAIKRKRPKKKLDGGPAEGAKKKCKRPSKVEETYAESLMTKLTNLPPLRILEPTIKPNFNSVPVFGAGDMNAKESQLKGHYGSATLPDKLDIYSYAPYTDKQPPATAILSAAPPPYRGFYNQEFPNIAKALEKNDLSLVLKPPIELENSSICRDFGSPDTVISSSSPESCLYEPLCKWPKLVFVDKLFPEHKRMASPEIPLFYPVPVRLYPREWSEMDSDKDKENIPGDGLEVAKPKLSGMGSYSAPLKDSGNVAVTLTLTSAAAEDICGVLSALANLLKIPIPASYEVVERTDTPPSQKLGLYRRSKNSDVSIHSLMNGKPRFCRHCDIVVLSAGIRKKASDLPGIPKEDQDEEDEVIFCSTNCYMQFALTHRSILEEKGAAAVVDHVGETAFDENSKLVNDEDLPSEELALGSELKPEDMDISDLGINQDMLGLRPLTTSHPFDAELLTDKMEISEEKKVKRKWKSIKYKYWSADVELTEKAKKKDNPAEKPARPFYSTIKPSHMPKDERKCLFCHSTGDGDTEGAARLLNMDVNKWVHLNCALWSYEVYETVNGALMNVEVAFKRSRLLSCYACHKQGASVRCFKSRCPVIYHFPCAKKERCAFFKDKTVLCPQHVHKGNPENKLDSTAVFRRVYINREEHKQVASMIQDEKFVMRIGSLIFLNIGQLLPTQIQAFHNTNCIYPVGYKVIRMYWSMKKLGRRSQYVCSISDVGGKPEFSIQLKDSSCEDFILKDKTSKGAWQKVLYPIEKMRKQAKTIKMFPDFITGDDLFGLTEPSVLRIIESLPGVETLYDYNFRYGRSPFLELPLAINPTGCARSEPKLRTHFKRAHTLHTSSTARSFHSAFAGFYPEVSLSSPYIKQFVHSKSSQYRKMKTEWRNNVYLARSRIQGLGLYAARDMEKHTMVIEYIGQLIRNEIAERNEAIYEAQNRGIYMFRLDENRVIDATMCGGLARYINHSCNPNCVTEAVQIDRENKIIIITNRRVTRGEELSYDYKFEVEDDKHKIPCLCGAPNCRKWMN